MMSLVNNVENLKKQENLFIELIEIILLYPQLLMDCLNDYAYNQFEQKKYNEGLKLSAQFIMLLIIAFDEDSETQIEMLASYLGTFSYGLYLNGHFKDAVKISDTLITLSPDHQCISEHLINRGNSKLKLNFIKGAKLDFEKS